MPKRLLTRVMFDWMIKVYWNDVESIEVLSTDSIVQIYLYSISTTMHRRAFEQYIVHAVLLNFRDEVRQTLIYNENILVSLQQSKHEVGARSVADFTKQGSGKMEYMVSNFSKPIAVVNPNTPLNKSRGCAEKMSIWHNVAELYSLTKSEMKCLTWFFREGPAGSCFMLGQCNAVIYLSGWLYVVCLMGSWDYDTWTIYSVALVSWSS